MSTRINSLADLILDEACNKGYEPATPRDELCGSGIVSIRKSGIKATETASKLLKKGVSVSPRSGWLRAAPHFYQNEDEICRFVDLLP